MKKQLVSWLHEAQAIGMLFALAKARLSSRRYMVPSSCICKKCRSNPKANVHRKHTLNAALKRGRHQLCKQPHWRQASEAAEVPGRFGMSCSAPELMSWPPLASASASPVLDVRAPHRAEHKEGRDGPAWRSPHSKRHPSFCCSFSHTFQMSSARLFRSHIALLSALSALPDI